MTHFYYLSGESLERQAPHEGVARAQPSRRVGQKGLLQGDSGGSGQTTAAATAAGVRELYLFGDGLQRINLDPAVSNHYFSPQNRLSV